MAAALIPLHPSLTQLREIASGCRACHLWEHATQTVFGEGPAQAKLLFVGEQPGNDEDLDGHPFVGPAGKLFNLVLEEVGIDRTDTYVTNVVKHFKWEARGKRRIHAKPNAAEVNACFPWLQSEIAVVKPKLIVCLGATAAQALLGRSFRVTKQRGEVLTKPGTPPMMATVHPSSILRAPDHDAREAETQLFIADIKAAQHYISTSIK